MLGVNARRRIIMNMNMICSCSCFGVPDALPLNVDTGKFRNCPGQKTVFWNRIQVNTHFSRGGGGADLDPATFNYHFAVRLFSLVYSYTVVFAISMDS